MSLETTGYVFSALEHSAQLFRQAYMQLLSGTGVVGATDLEVTEHSPANLSVNVAPGYVIVPGTQGSTTGQRANAGSQHSTYTSLPLNLTSQGVYCGVAAATTNLTLSEANAEHERIDLIVASAQDAFYSGSFNQMLLQVVTGTPAASPKAPTPPENTVVLAQVAVAAKATTVKTANITSERPFASAAFANGGRSWTVSGGYTKAEAEAGVMPSPTRPALVTLSELEAGHTLTIGAKEAYKTSTSPLLLYVPVAQVWKVASAVGSSSVLLL